MSKINGSLLLLYADGTLIAAQKNYTGTITQDLFPTSSKDDAGWETHGNGDRSYSIALDALVSTSGLTAAGLLAYITGRSKFLLVLKGFTYDQVAQCSLKDLSIDTPRGEAMALTGSIQSTGEIGDMQNQMVTNPGASDSYDTFTVSGVAVTSAIDAGGGAIADSNSIAVTDTYKYLVFTFLTLNSGEAPAIGIYSGAAYISNEETLSEGANFITLIAEATDGTSTLRIENTAATNFALTDIYLWEVAV